MNYIDPDSRNTTYDLNNMQAFYRNYNNSYLRKERIRSLLNSIKKSWLAFIITFVIAQTIMFAAWYFMIEIGWKR